MSEKREFKYAQIFDAFVGLREAVSERQLPPHVVAEFAELIMSLGDTPLADVTRGDGGVTVVKPSARLLTLLDAIRHGRHLRPGERK
jgi:hypothetical protein